MSKDALNFLCQHSMLLAPLVEHQSIQCYLEIVLGWSVNVLDVQSRRNSYMPIFGSDVSVCSGWIVVGAQMTGLLGSMLISVAGWVIGESSWLEVVAMQISFSAWDRPGMLSFRVLKLMFGLVQEMVLSVSMWMIVCSSRAGVLSCDVGCDWLWWLEWTSLWTVVGTVWLLDCCAACMYSSIMWLVEHGKYTVIEVTELVG